MTYDIRLKRVYLPAEESDGARVLVDRLWPRGKRKEDLECDAWLQDAAPSAALRRAWHRDAIDADAFVRDYTNELKARAECLLPLMRHARRGAVTLLTATRDPEHSHLPTLCRVLLAELDREDREDGSGPSSPVCYDR
ncbi:MAG: DUF488 family protein [Cellvibrionaceae bacterium]